MARRLLKYPAVMVSYLFTLLTMAYLWLVGARRRRLQVGRVSLVYYRVGPEDGEPWLLLHGLGSVAAGWGPVLRAMRRDCRMIVPAAIQRFRRTAAPRPAAAPAPSPSSL